MGFDLTGAGTTMALSQGIENQKARELAEKTRAQQEADQAKLFHQALLSSMVDINQPNMPQSYANVANTMGMDNEQANQLYNAIRNNQLETLNYKKALAQASVGRAQAGQQNVDLATQKAADERADKVWDNLQKTIPSKPNEKRDGIQVTDSKGSLTEAGYNWVQNNYNAQLKNEGLAFGTGNKYATFLMNKASAANPAGTSTSGKLPVPTGWQKGTYKGQIGIFNPQTKEFKAGDY